MGVEGQPQQGRITLQEFKEKGVYQIERKQGDNFWLHCVQGLRGRSRCPPAGHRFREIRDLLPVQGRILNQAKLRAGDEWKPYPTYVTPVEGHRDRLRGFRRPGEGRLPLPDVQHALPSFRQRRIRQHQVSGRGVCHTGVHGREGGEGRTVSPRATRFWWRVLTEACFA